MRSAFADISMPLVPRDFMTHDPQKKKIFFHILYFNSEGSYQIASIFDIYAISNIFDSDWILFEFFIKYIF